MNIICINSRSAWYIFYSDAYNVVHNVMKMQLISWIVVNVNASLNMYIYFLWHRFTKQERRSNIKLLLQGIDLREHGPPGKLPDARPRPKQLPCPQHQPLRFDEPENKAGEAVLGSARRRLFRFQPPSATVTRPEDTAAATHKAEPVLVEVIEGAEARQLCNLIGKRKKSTWYWTHWWAMGRKGRTSP